MKHILLLITCIALFPLHVAGQGYSNEADMPFWTKGYFKEATNSYLEVVSAFGYDLAEARNKAAKEVVARRSLATGSEANVTISDGNVSVQSNHELIVKARIIDEYAHHTPQGYTVYLLVQTAKNPTYTYEPVTLTRDYRVGARPFVPGMAQLYKGQTLKGVLFISAEVAAIAGIITSAGMRSSHDSKIKRSHNVKTRQNHIDAVNRCTNVRNGFIAGAVAIYAWNVIDGFVAKGKKHIAIGRAQARFAPFADTQSAGLAFNLNF